jgi:hypothetical protein
VAEIQLNGDLRQSGDASPGDGAKHGACLFDGKLSLHWMIKLAGAMSAIGR